MDLKQKHKLKKFIRELESIKGRHTELVSVYVPAGYDLNKVISHLAEEQGTASNIKDKKTRQNVIDSLERCIRHLRLFKRTPENGLAVFAGNTDAQEQKTNIQIWSIEPPVPLKTRIYRCDQVFQLDILKSMLESTEVYALIVMDRREATLGLLRGTSIEEIYNLTSGVPGKFKTGGQSAARFSRIRENMAKEFYRRISEVCNAEFLGKKELKGILVGGPGLTKQEFIEELNEELRRKIIAVEDLTYTGESGLHDLVDKAKEVLAEQDIIKEKKIMNRFFEMLAKDSSRIAYGMQEVERALDMGAVEILLLSESLKEETIEQFEGKAEKTGTEVVLVSVDTREGAQLRDLTGIGAILRYAIG